MKFTSNILVVAICVALATTDVRGFAPINSIPSLNKSVGPTVAERNNGCGPLFVLSRVSAFHKNE